MKWFSAKDVLPDSKRVGQKTILILGVLKGEHDKNPEIHFGYYYIDETGCGEFLTEEGLSFELVTHWMRLPTFPKPDSTIPE